MDTYEQKYKEANDKVAARFGTNVAKEIFIDLYESEDEKIRKQILDCFRTMKQKGCFPPKHKEQYNSWIAWIEKQCKNLTDKEMKELLHTEYEKGRADTIAEMQKPAWSNNEKLMLADIIEATERSNIFTEDYQRELVDWLKTLKQRNTWKPSKEQMLALKDAEGVVGSLTIIGEQLKSLYQDLKKL